MTDSRPQNEELRVSTRLEGVSTWRDCHSQFRHRWTCTRSAQVCSCDRCAQGVISCAQLVDVLQLIDMLSLFLVQSIVLHSIASGTSWPLMYIVVLCSFIPTYPQCREETTARILTITELHALHGMKLTTIWQRSPTFGRTIAYIDKFLFAFHAHDYD